jgi:hypothetical protein
LRNGYLNVAKSLTELAANLDAEPGVIETDGAPRSPAGAKKRLHGAIAPIEADRMVVVHRQADATQT